MEQFLDTVNMAFRDEDKQIYFFLLFIEKLAYKVPDKNHYNT